MNILVPVSWLDEYIETRMTPPELAALGSLHGPSFERIETIEGESVYDIEITTNRVDAMSIKGLARELAAIAGDKVTPKKLTQTYQLDGKPPVKSLPLPKVTVCTDKVHKIVCIVLDKVKNVDSPDWMQRRLHQIGQNSHGIIIDMSNYVTHELGHPCHTFDYDKVMALGGEFIVTTAKPGKKFVTLDGEEHQTVGGEVVFENKDGEIIDLPAIKGTANTAISPETTRVLFWLENMDAATVRQASMSHAIRTVAAILNEKNVDPALMEEVLALGTQILQEYAGAKVASSVYTYEHDSLKKPVKPIKFDLDRLDEYLGIQLAAKEVSRILTALGFQIKPESKRIWSVSVPSFRRHDVTMAADLIEEVARLYGYHRLPSRLDFPSVVIPPQEQFDFGRENRVKHLLVDAGLTEVYTYSMISREQVTGDPEAWLSLLNPLTEDKVYLRQSLLPSLRQVYQDNQVDPHACAGVFELANVYFPGKTRDSVDEQLRLAWLTTLPYREVRSLIERVAVVYGLTITIDRQGQIFLPDQRLVGHVQVDNAQLASVELLMPVLVQAAQPMTIHGNLRAGTPVREDLTFVVPEGAAIGEIIAQIQTVSDLIVAVSLGERYQDHVTFNLTYQAETGTLSSADLLPVRQEIVRVLGQDGISLVGKLEEGAHGN